jgi:hypothetical protein
MMEASYSWRPLGELLVERGFLTKGQLEAALAEQRRTGRLVGEILVESGQLSAFSLARALSEQHGVQLRATGAAGTPPASTTTSQPTVWRPLGKLLVENGYLTRTKLREALAQQRESGGRRLLGEILVGEGFLSGTDLARALAEQQGVQFDPEQVEPQLVATTSSTGNVVYRVRDVSYAPRYRPDDILYESPSFLEAVDYAAEFVEDVDPEGVEIERWDGTSGETVWTYSDSRAAATAASRRNLAETFGFDPTLWRVDAA